MALAAFVMDFWWLSVTLFVAGIGIAPALAVLFAIVSASVKFSDTAEAYGWVGTGQLIGAALGSAVAGFLIDAYSAQGAFFAAAGLALLGMLAGGGRAPVASRPARPRREPHPRHRTGAPAAQLREGRRMSQPNPPVPLLPLADGAAIPQLGFGLYKVPAPRMPCGCASRRSTRATATSTRRRSTATNARSARRCARRPCRARSCSS